MTGEKEKVGEEEGASQVGSVRDRLWMKAEGCAEASQECHK